MQVVSINFESNKYVKEKHTHFTIDGKVYYLHFYPTSFLIPSFPVSVRWKESIKIGTDKKRKDTTIVSHMHFPVWTIDEQVKEKQIKDCLVLACAAHYASRGVTKYIERAIQFAGGQVKVQFVLAAASELSTLCSDLIRYISSVYKTDTNSKYGYTVSKIRLNTITEYTFNRISDMSLIAQDIFSVSAAVVGDCTSINPHNVYNSIGAWIAKQCRIQTKQADIPTVTNKDGDEVPNTDIFGNVDLDLFNVYHDEVTAILTDRQVAIFEYLLRGNDISKYPYKDNGFSERTLYYEIDIIRKRIANFYDDLSDTKSTKYYTSPCNAKPIYTDNYLPINNGNCVDVGKRKYNIDIGINGNINSYRTITTQYLLPAGK